MNQRIETVEMECTHQIISMDIDGYIQIILMLTKQISILRIPNSKMEPSLAYSITIGSSEHL